MKKTAVMILTAAAGFIGGIIINEIIAVMGYLTLGEPARPTWLKALPFAGALVGAIAVGIYWAKQQRSSR